MLDKWLPLSDRVVRRPDLAGAVEGVARSAAEAHVAAPADLWGIEDKAIIHNTYNTL